MYFEKPCGHCQAVFRLLLLRCQSTKCVDGRDHRDRGFVALSSSKQGQRAFTFARSFKPELKSTGKRTTESNSYIFLFLFSSASVPSACVNVNLVRALCDVFLASRILVGVAVPVSVGRPAPRTRRRTRLRDRQPFAEATPNMSGSRRGTRQALSLSSNRRICLHNYQRT